MKPLVVLLVTFVIALVVQKIVLNAFDYALAGRVAMAVMLLFTSIAHFKFTKGMVMMIPPQLPFKTALIYVTGIFEILAALGLLIPQFRVITAWLLIVMFVLLLPANIYAAIKHVDLEKATYDGSGPRYLWFRIPLQLLFIAWVYLSAIDN